MHANGYAHPDALVDDRLGRPSPARIPRVRLVEVDVDTAAYDTGHIPGAIGWNWQDDLQRRPLRDIPTKEEWETLLSRSGIGNDDLRRPLRRQQQLVRRLRLLALQALRPPERRPDERRPQEVARRGARDDDRGRRSTRRPPTQAQRAESGVCAPTATTSPPRSAARDRAGRRPLAGGVLGRVAGAGEPAAGGSAARRPHPRRAEHPLGDGGRRGRHLQVGRRSAGHLRRQGDHRRDKPTIAYCRIGERSAHTWFVLTELLGYPDVRNYDGSWTEWGSLIGAPIER